MKNMRLKILRMVALILWISISYTLTTISSLFAASADSITLMVTPWVTYGVSITSVVGEGYNFGTVDINSVTHSTSAIVVQNIGNVASQWQLRAVDSQNWSASDTVGHDQFVLMGVFTSTESASQVTTSEFTDGQDEVLTNYQTANGSDNTGKYNAGCALNAIPPSGQANSKRNLWLKLKTPSTTSTAVQHQFRLYITAVQTGQQ